MLSSGYKFHVQFHITSRCNLHCRHCYEGAQGQVIEWELDEFKQAIEKLWACFAKWGIYGEISLIGGEPTLHPRFYEMVEYLHQRRDVSSISILTNGVHFDTDFAEKMKKYDCYVQVSIDGNHAEQHDYIRGTGTYNKTMANARILSQAGIPVSVHCVLSRYTYPITDELFHTLSENGISQLAFSRIVPFGNAHNSDMLTPEELKNSYDFIYSMAQKYADTGLFVATTRPLWCTIDGKIGGFCPAGIQTITILENGDIMPCRRLPIVIGNIKLDSFYKVWYTDKTLERLRDRSKINHCNSCHYLERCGGARCIAYASTGNYMAEDPQCWI